MRDFRRNEEQDNIEERVIQIDRITRVVKGGRRLRFRAIVVVGDGAGQVGLAVDKSSEVVGAIQKATRKARKNMFTANLSDTTVPHEIIGEHAGARVFLKPARKGTGVIAGGAVRPILEVAGVKDVLSKIQGSSSKLNNSYAAIEALKGLRKFEQTKEAKEVNPSTPKASNDAKDMLDKTKDEKVSKVEDAKKSEITKPDKASVKKKAVKPKEAPKAAKEKK